MFHSNYQTPDRHLVRCKIELNCSPLLEKHHKHSHIDHVISLLVESKVGTMALAWSHERPHPLRYKHTLNQHHHL